ncbi:TolC family protein [Epilithonimonas ginsengisoli]|uniref:TolC family protein n=1 Tax=Epilithonimonas ginsengisoli TaxID=1245592 RepID=A0ABU4JIF0_9FLAO|nr:MULTISPECIES: TolC family protein [Chryseobacterium group]MBV6880754.1 TolC family protein [Epilithonimonas sp. FP105]MDW8549301.1 TolC family protein [Epilithonimonas ginsengisoli]
MTYNRVFFPVCLMVSVTAFSQYSLKQCIDKSQENNSVIKLAEQSLETREKLLQSNKNNYLPKVDLLAGYNYIGEPLRVNLQQVKDGIVEGTANQSVYAANSVFQQITGQPLTQQIQDVIYQTSKDIIGAVYPNYNPAIAKQSYFLAGVAVRQPIYLGGKLKASQQLSQQQVESGKANLQTSKDLTAYNIALQYIQIMYLNSMIAKQQESVSSLDKNEKYAGNLMTAEIIPPYQKNWADIAKKQADTNLKNLNLEKQNALLMLKDLMGISLDEPLEITEKLNENTVLPPFSDSGNNADLKLLRSKKTEAETGLNITKSLSKPNIFAIGNVQFFRKDLPLITPPWLVGVEMQWTLFDPERKSRNLASESLVKEADLLIEQKQKAVNLAAKIAENKLLSLKEQSETLDASRQQTYTTTEMVRKRMENSLSSVKDVNDALQLQYEAEKLYYTSVVAYQTALATYFYINGNPENITNYIP